jgi:hypothetical protein
MNATSGAFPLLIPGGEMQKGMLQREYVAVAAMQALIASPAGHTDIDALVQKAFKIADAFIDRASRRDN